LEHINTAQYLIATTNGVAWSELEKTYTTQTSAELSYLLPTTNEILSIGEVKLGTEVVGESHTRPRSFIFSLSAGVPKIVFQRMSISADMELKVIYYIAPAAMSQPTDVCVLPSELVKLGAIALAKEEQGIDATLDKGLFDRILQQVIFQRNKRLYW
jgi:hypothetical protein